MKKTFYEKPIVKVVQVKTMQMLADSGTNASRSGYTHQTNTAEEGWSD